MSKQITWTQADATALRAYTNDNPNFLAALRAKRPKLEGATLEAAAMNAKKAEGYEDLIADIESMAEPRKDDATGPAFVNTTDD